MTAVFGGTYVAVDVGGTGIKAAVVDPDGTLLSEATWPTPVSEGPEAVVQAIRATVLTLKTGADGVGVVVPGAVDAAAGIARYSANLGWRDVPLAAVLAADTGLPVGLEHDVRAAGIAEQTLGLTAGVADSLLVVLGTGVAGLLTVGGRPAVGAGGLAGEIGHTPVWPQGETCPCGQRGCLERYASAAAIARRYLDRTGASLSTATIAGRLSSDADAAEVWDDATSALGIALATYTMLLDPSVIVLGGGLAGAGAALLDPVRAELERRIIWRDAPPVELSPLGGKAGLLGAAIVASRAAAGS
jgi:glucokinase